MQLIALVTFVGIVTIVLGIYWVLEVRPEARKGAQIKKRLKTALAGTPGAKLGVFREAKRRSQLKGLDTFLQRSSHIVAPLERLIEESDSSLSVGLFLLLSACAGLGGYLLVTFFTPYAAIGVLVGILLTGTPYAYLRWQRGRRLLKFEEIFPEALDLMARALRAGHAFATGLGMVASELPDPVGSEFRLLHDRQNFGMPLQDALRSFAQRVPIIDARFFVTAVLTQREAGGNLSEVLDNLARIVRERFKVKRQVRVVSAHARMTGWVLVGLPPLTALGLMMIVPDTMRVLVEDPLGIRLIVAAIVLQILGGLMVKKLVNIEY